MASIGPPALGAKGCVKRLHRFAQGALPWWAPVAWSGSGPEPGRCLPVFPKVDAASPRGLMAPPGLSALGAKGSVRDRLTPPGRIEGFRPRELYSIAALARYGALSGAIFYADFGGWRHHLPAPLGSVSLDSQSPTASCESSFLATTSWWDYGYLAMEPCLYRKA